MTGLDGNLVRQLADAHAVYRLYDDAGKLLYVGVTGNLGRRLDNHAEKRWFLLVSSITLEWFRDRTAAEKAELAAIRNEGPEHNVSGAVLQLQVRRAATRRHQERLRAHLAAKHDGQVKAEMTISDAVYAGVFGTTRIDTARKRVQRAGLQPCGHDGLSNLYRLTDLKDLAR